MTRIKSKLNSLAVWRASLTLPQATPSPMLFPGFNHRFVRRCRIRPGVGPARDDLVGNSEETHQGTTCMRHGVVDLRFLASLNRILRGFVGQVVLDKTPDGSHGGQSQPVFCWTAKECFNIIRVTGKVCTLHIPRPNHVPHSTFSHRCV
ncbi:hypothetical protein BC832DRAFT_391224 [Gaertneriomyces semiglobifer]|nr:hypothetical protein BC832DRAFT_391224 [Gaertneriomyces semiglobifer]